MRGKKWIKTIRDRYIVHSVPFFFKQWGGTRKKFTGRELDGRTWDEMPVSGSKNLKRVSA
jgi:protein gp37